MDILKKRQHYLRENFPPEFKRKVSTVRIEQFEEERRALLLNVLPFLHNQICEVVHNGEPQALQDWVTNLHIFWQGIITFSATGWLRTSWFLSTVVRRRESLHIFFVTCVEAYSVHLNLIGNYILLRCKMACAFINKVECLWWLTEEIVFCELVKAVNKLDKVIFEDPKTLSYGPLEWFEGLDYEHLFAILGSQSEDINYNTPAWFEVPRFLMTHVCHCHNNVLFDFATSMEVMKHNSLKWLQEVLLEMIMPEFLFH